MVDSLLNQLEELQIKNHTRFLKGNFASQRCHAFLTYQRDDENVFFASVIAFVLLENLAKLTPAQQVKANNILKNVRAIQENFKNFQGGITYNFFKTNPMDFFPNGKIMHRFRKFKLADDADDTVYVYLTSKKTEKEHQALFNKLRSHANGVQKWSNSTLKAYQKLQCYGVYFGEKMHIEIDFCVLCTILIWQERYIDHSDQHVEDSYQYIIKAIQTKDYLHKPKLISPCYPSFSQVAYHLARLMKQTKNKDLLSSRGDVLQDVLYMKEQVKQPIDDLYLSLALIHLDPLKFKDIECQVPSLDVKLFYTSPILMTKQLWIRKLLTTNLFNAVHLKTKCSANIVSLLLELELNKV